MTLMPTLLHRRSAKLVALLAVAGAVAAQTRSRTAEVVRVENLSHDVKRVTFRARGPQSFTFQPGQYLFLTVPEDYVKVWNQRYGTSHRNISRPYSIASSPTRLPLFDLIIKHQPAPRGQDVPPGLASTYIHTALMPGDILAISGAAGSLFTADPQPGPFILVAGGAGVSPFVGLLEYWFENREDERRKIYLYFGVRNRKDLLLHETFTKWAAARKNFFYLPALSHPEPGDAWEGETGYINLVLEKDFPTPLEAEVYIAGSPIMIRETIKVLQAKRFSSERIHHDPIPEN